MSVVNDVGVDPNRLLEHPHTVALLQFVCGLGPRKASSLLKVQSANQVVLRCKPRTRVSNYQEKLIQTDPNRIFHLDIKSELLTLILDH